MYKIIRIYKPTEKVRKIIKFTNVSFFRDFTGGTLGLAWVASASGASGGICETYKRYTENINGVHHTAKRSLNTGIITFVNYNSPVPPKGKKFKYGTKSYIILIIVFSVNSNLREKSKYNEMIF